MRLCEIVNKYNTIYDRTGVRYTIIAPNDRISLTPSIIRLIREVWSVIHDLSSCVYQNDGLGNEIVYIARIICIVKYVLQIKREKLLGLDSTYFKHVIRNPPQETLIKESLFVMRGLFKPSDIFFTTNSMLILMSSLDIKHCRPCTRLLSGMSARQVGKTDTIQILQSAAMLYYARKKGIKSQTKDYITDDFLFVSKTKMMAMRTLEDAVNLCTRMHEAVSLSISRSKSSIVADVSENVLFNYDAHDVNGRTSVRGKRPVYTNIDEIGTAKDLFMTAFMPIMGVPSRICIALATPPASEAEKETLRNHLYTQSNMASYVDFVDVGFVCSKCKSTITDALTCTHKFHTIPIMKSISEVVSVYVRHLDTNTSHMSVLEEFKGYYNPFSTDTDSIFSTSTVDKLKHKDYKRDCLPLNHNTLVLSIDQDGGGGMSKNGLVLLSAYVHNHVASHINAEDCHIISAMEFSANDDRDISINAVSILEDCCRQYDMLQPYASTGYVLYIAAETNHNKRIIRNLLVDMKESYRKKNIRFSKVMFIVNKSKESRLLQKNYGINHVSNIIFNIRGPDMLFDMLKCTMSMFYQRGVTAISYNGNTSTYALGQYAKMKTQLKNMLINYSKNGKVSGKNKHSGVSDDIASASLIAFYALYSIAISRENSINFIDTNNIYDN